MTAKDGPGQADKAAAEKRTAEVAAANQKDAADRKAEARRADANDDRAGNDPATNTDPATDDAGGQLRAGSDDTPERPDGPKRQEGVDASVAPYPLYEDEDVEALASLAEGRGVEINRDVEKALLIKGLRDKDREGVGAGPDRDNAGDTANAQNPYPSYDQMPLEELRSLAGSRDVALNPEDRKAHLVTELRAADSGVNNAGVNNTVS